jgi:hypothetical protein
VIVASSGLGLKQQMQTETAAALPGAGMPSVFVYPMIAFVLRRLNPQPPRSLPG